LGSAVRSLQRALVKLGHLSREDFASGPGVYGPRTAQAVRSFQLQAGLSPSGQLDALTELALQQTVRR
jgi:peptidoglycan hydrolase-like protein with peptidoglycan-binding domain